MRSPRVPLVLLLTFVLAGLIAGCGTSGADEADATTTTERTKTTSTTRRSSTTEARRTTTTHAETTTTGDGPTPTTLARSAAAGEYVDALTSSLNDDGSEVFGQAQAACLAGAYVDAIGADALAAAGFSPSDFAATNGDDFDGKITLTDDMGNQVFDRFAPCGIDLPQLFRKVAGVDAPTPQQDLCLERILTPANLRRSFVADYTGNKLDSDPLDELRGCFKAG
jgi:hypothetical protein